MSDNAIQIENLCKSYIISHQQTGRAGKTIRELMTATAMATANTVMSPFSKEKKFSPQQEEFWALKDVSLTINQGEVVGFIGRNGAGKSTLLKLLSRITEPTSGRIKINGRVASLLEVGTGFHPELTGRENIFLNGAILGMSKVEIKRKFDEIVAFSEVEKFLDTPVKRYSSGMYVRLAFAVAAHLEPEILIVDEVLAVGDATFQKKCLGKMGDVAKKDGRTVLFVSHNMPSIRTLCQKAYLLNQGSLLYEGAPQDAIDKYLQSIDMLAHTGNLEDRTDRSGSGSARITSLSIEDADGKGIICSESRLKITLDYRGKKSISHPRLKVTVYDRDTNVPIFTLDTKLVGGIPNAIEPEGRLVCITEPIYMTEGQCHVELDFYEDKTLVDYVEAAAFFEVEASDIYGAGRFLNRNSSIMLIKHSWSLDAN